MVNLNFAKSISIGTRVISENSPAFIIAEAGVNHNGNMELAKKMVDIAVDAGVDAIKFQAFSTGALIIGGVQKAPYQKKSTGSAETQADMLRSLELTRAQVIEIADYCKMKDILLLFTPFDEESLELLNDIDLPCYKVASTDITNIPFLIKIASKGKPMLISVGMIDFSDIQKVLEELQPINRQIIVLQCTANYPIKATEVNLSVISRLKAEIDLLVGFSDHSKGIGAAPYSIPLGAKVVEKHFTIDKKMQGPDHKASLNPRELKALVKTIRQVELYMGDPKKILTESEKQTRKALQKNFVARLPISKGTILTLDNIVAKRTGGVGISPIDYHQVVGKRSVKDFIPDEIISL